MASEEAVMEFIIGLFAVIFWVWLVLFLIEAIYTACTKDYTKDYSNRDNKKK